MGKDFRDNPGKVLGMDIDLRVSKPLGHCPPPTTWSAAHALTTHHTRVRHRPPPQAMGRKVRLTNEQRTAMVQQITDDATVRPLSIYFTICDII